MKDILANIHYGVTLAVLIAFIVFMLAIVMLKGVYRCLRPSK